VIGADHCPPLAAPKNGAVSYIVKNKLAQMACKFGFFPDRKITYLYVCQNQQWKDPSPIEPALVPLPDCLRKYWLNITVLSQPEHDVRKTLLVTTSYDDIYLHLILHTNAYRTKIFLLVAVRSIRTL